MPRSADYDEQARIVKLEHLAAAVERWLSDPRYVTEQLMIRALQELHELEAAL